MKPSILTTTVGSYAEISWLRDRPSAEALLDATRVMFDVQRQAGIDLPTDGELYRFDPQHPDTNGMIDAFTRAMSGIRDRIGRSDEERFRQKQEMAFRAKPAGVVTAPLGEGSLNLLSDCRRAAAVAGGPFKFTVTSPFMLARTLLDLHYGNFEDLLMAVADVLAAQLAGLPCACIQVDEANVPGCPEQAPMAARAINRLLDAAACETAVHLCFGNYGGQTIQSGTWAALLGFMNDLHVDHLVLEAARRPDEDLHAMRDIRSEIGIGLGVIDIKVNRIETPEEVARRIERAAAILGPERIRYVHPDCGFWMLKRSVADRKIAALVAGRDLFLGTRREDPAAGTP